MNIKRKKSKHISINKNDILFILILIIPIVLMQHMYKYSLGDIGRNSVRLLGIDRCKQIIEEAYPVIYLVFNSGKSGITIKGEINKKVSQLLGFELTESKSIIRAQSAHMLYYNKLYLEFLVAEKKDISNGGVEKNSEKIDLISSIETRGEDSDQLDDVKIEYGSIKFRSEFPIKIDIEKLKKEELSIDTGKLGPKVLLFHTHTTESYLKNVNELGKKGVPVRSDDASKNVVGVGSEVAHFLRKEWDVETIHNGTNHIPNGDTGCYVRSLSTAEKILKSYPSIGIVLDIHRDGIGTGKKLRVTKTYNKKTYAQMMLVVGTDATGLNHPKWRENLKFAIHLQDRLNKIIPGIMRPIHISKNRYNQHTRNGALIVEIGGDGNTVGEAMLSAEVLAQGISELVER